MNNTSDINLTTNVENLQQNTSLDIINSLKPVSFIWKDNISNQSKQNTQDIGFIAHELQMYYPSLVTGIKDNEEYQTVNYVGLIPILVKAFQEQNETILELKRKILQKE